jgi:hypothetical protein
MLDSRLGLSGPNAGMISAIGAFSKSPALPTDRMVGARSSGSEVLGAAVHPLFTAVFLKPRSVATFNDHD